MKKTLSFILTLILIISCVPAVFAADSREIDGISISGTNRLFLTVNYTDGTEVSAEVTDFIESEEQPDNIIDMLEGDFVTERGTFRGIIRFDVSDTGIQRFAYGVQLEIGGALSNKLDRNLFLLLQKIKKELVPAMLARALDGSIWYGQVAGFSDDLLAGIACDLVGKHACLAAGQDGHGFYRKYSADVVIEATTTVFDARDFFVTYCDGYDEATKTVVFYDVPRSDLKGNVTVLNSLFIFTATEEADIERLEMGFLPDGRIFDVWERHYGDLLGDLNTDYPVDLKDLLLLRKLLAGEADLTMVDEDEADFDGNGVVNMKDVLRLRKIIAGAV